MVAGLRMYLDDGGVYPGVGRTSTALLGIICLNRMSETHGRQTTAAQVSSPALGIIAFLESTTAAACSGVEAELTVTTSARRFRLFRTINTVDWAGPPVLSRTLVRR